MKEHKEYSNNKDINLKCVVISSCSSHSKQEGTSLNAIKIEELFLEIMPKSIFISTVHRLIPSAVDLKLIIFCRILRGGRHFRSLHKKKSSKAV